MKLILIGWFIIRLHTVDGTNHSYLLEDPVKNRKIAASLEHPLSYESDTWIKLRIVATCTKQDETFEQPGVSVLLHRNLSICNAEQVEELKCTEENSFIVNGIPYC